MHLAVRRPPVLACLAAALLAAVPAGCGGGGGGGITELPPPVDATPRPANGYTADELAYFAEIAPGFEVGALSRVIRKWRYDVLVSVGDGATAAERAYVDSLAAELTALIGGAVRVRPDRSGPVRIEFVSDADFARSAPPALLGAAAFFTIQPDASQHLFSASVYIRAALSPGLRRRFIREELTQALGLGNDSRRYPTSTFYDGWHEEPGFAPIDRALVEMLYRPEVAVGMTADQATAVLRTLERRPR